MRNIRVDQHGVFRCWKCKGTNFNSKRTMRSKVMFGVGSMVTKKKLKCLECGEYNDVGNAKKITVPDEKPATPDPVVPHSAPNAPPADLADQLTKLAGLHDSGVLTEDEFNAQKARLLGTALKPTEAPTSEDVPSAGWTS